MYRQYKNFKKGSIKFVKMPTVKNVLCLFYEKKKKHGLQRMLRIWLQQKLLLIIFCYGYESVMRR